MNENDEKGSDGLEKGRSSEGTEFGRDEGEVDGGAHRCMTDGFVDNVVETLYVVETL